MNFEEAIKETKQTNWIYRPMFLFPKDSYICLGSGCKYYICNIKTNKVELYSFTLSDIEGDDWEIFGERRSLK